MFSPKIEKIKFVYFPTKNQAFTVNRSFQQKKIVFSSKPVFRQNEPKRFFYKIGFCRQNHKIMFYQNRKNIFLAKTVKSCFVLMSSSSHLFQRMMYTPKTKPYPIPEATAGLHQCSLSIIDAWSSSALPDQRSF